MKEFEEILREIFANNGENINCQLPCQVKAINGNYVDVLMIRNDEIEDTIISNIPIKREETGRAYIFLGIKEGDYGTLRFYDKSIENYTIGEMKYNGDDRNHSIQDRCFELGFIPDPQAFVYPSNIDIEIGLKDGTAKINMVSGIISFTSPQIALNGVVTANELISGNGATGKFTQFVEVVNGIVVGGA